MLRYNIRTGVKKIKTKTTLMISGATLGFVGLVAAIAIPLGAHAASPVWVAPAPAPIGGGSCASPDFNTISAAVAAASSGDIINVCPGTYPENVTIPVALTLNGAQAGVDARTR